MDILEKLNDGYIRSVRESDVAWFERHLADDFVNGNPDGTLLDRAGLLRQIARPMPLRDFIHARTVYTKAVGTPGAGRYTDVWARRGSDWLCVCADVTRG